MPVDLRGVQATVVQPYRRPISRHLLLKFGDRDGARGFLAGLAGKVTMGGSAPDALPDPLLNVGIAFPGLGALGVDPALLTQFDAMYKAGPDGVALGDATASSSDPATWWEGCFATADLHCVVHLYARADDALEAATADVRSLAQSRGVTELVPRKDGRVLDARSLGGAKLHFGYIDGISHVDVAWDDADGAGKLNFRDFLLGYSTPEHASAPGSGPAADLVRDSCYGVLRWIYQDVAAFNRFLAAEGPALFPSLPAADAEELLAAKLMGRWRDGTPLVLSPNAPDAGLAASNDFGYAAQDPDGRRCPFSAHIRVVNPRDQPLDPIVESVPRVLRRGMPYGPPLEQTQDDGRDRGIVGIFLCADIRRQVYRLTNWVKRNDFSPVYDANRRTQDALVANRAVAGSDTGFTIPGENGTRTVAELPDFVRTKGTALLLYPGKATLQLLAAP